MSGSRLEIGAVAAWVVFLAAVIGSGAVVVAALRATGVLDLTDDPGGVAAYDQASY